MVKEVSATSKLALFFKLYFVTSKLFVEESSSSNDVGLVVNLVMKPWIKCDEKAFYATYFEDDYMPVSLYLSYFSLLTYLVVVLVLMITLIQFFVIFFTLYICWYFTNSGKVMDFSC